MEFRTTVISCLAFGIPDSTLGAQFREKWAPFYFSSAKDYDQAKQELEQITLKERCSGLIPVADGCVPEPKLCVFDVDSTLIENEMIDEMARYCGVFDQVSKVTESAMRGELEFHQALEQRLACLKNFAHDFIPDLRKRIKLRPGINSFLHELKLMGSHIAFVSGGFKFIVQDLAQHLNAHDIYCHDLAWSNDGFLLGLAHDSPRVDGQGKADYVHDLQKKLQIFPENTWVFGDGTNDIPMMGRAQIKISVVGKPKVNSQANVWLRYGDYRDLSALIGMI